MFKNFAFLLFAALLTGCISNVRPGGSSLVNDPSTNAVTSDEVQNPLDLSDYLRRVSGVKIVGSGAGAQVAIRGPISFYSGQGPLYVLDGTIIGYDYSTLYNAVHVTEISRVKVLKSASEAGFYGVRGAGGVIEVELRKGVK